MHPAVARQIGNVFELHSRRTEAQRAEEVEAVVRRQPRPAPSSQYARTDTLALGLALGVLVLLAAHILAVGGPG